MKTNQIHDNLQMPKLPLTHTKIYILLYLTKNFNYKSRMLQYTKKYGYIDMNWIIYFYAPIGILSPLYTYYMAVIVEKSAKPFPHSTITETANPYPQNILFRFLCGIGIFIFALIFHTIYRYMNAEAKKSGFPQMNNGYYYFMLVGLLGFCIATQSIDGKSNGPLHTPSAVIFFLILEIYIVYTTLYIRRLHQWDSSIISARSLLLKQVLCGYVSFVWVFCLYMTYGKANSIDYVVVVEWNAYLVSFVWCFSYFEEWKKIKLTFVGPEQ